MLLLNCAWLCVIAFPMYTTQYSMSYTTVNHTCNLHTTSEMHESCAEYAYYQIKPLLLDIQTLLNQKKSLESVLYLKNIIGLKDDEIKKLTREYQILETLLKSSTLWSELVSGKDKQMGSLNCKMFTEKHKKDAAKYTTQQIFYTTVSQMCAPPTTPEMHETCGVYAFYQMKPLLLDIQTLLNYKQLLESAIEMLRLNFQIQEMSKQNEENDRQLIEQGSIIQDIHSTVSNRDNRILDLQREVGKLNSTILTLENNVEAKDKELELQVEDYKKTLLDSNNTINVKNEDIRMLRSKYQVLETQLKTLNDIISKKDKEINEFNAVYTEGLFWWDMVKKMRWARIELQAMG